MEKKIDKSLARIFVISAIIIILGSMLSGPIGYFIVNLVNPIPWKDVQSFAALYQPIQTLPYWFGFIYLTGFIVFISASRQLLVGKNQLYGDGAIITTAIFGSLISINYILQIGYVPRAVSAPTELLAVFVMNNPKSICWLLEMFGWGFLGAATWFISPGFNSSRLQKIVKVLFIINGVGSIASAFLTPLVPSSLLLQIPGLVAYFVWNFLIWVAMFLIILDFKNKM